MSPLRTLFWTSTSKLKKTSSGHLQASKISWDNPFKDFILTYFLCEQGETYYCTWLIGQGGLPAEHDNDDNDVDGCPQDEDWNPPHQLDHVAKTMFGKSIWRFVISTTWNYFLAKQKLGWIRNKLFDFQKTLCSFAFLTEASASHMP